MKRHTLAELPLDKLKRVITLREQIDNLQLELNQLLNDGTVKGGREFGNGLPVKSGLSVAGRARIAEAQRLRWSKHHAQNGKVVKKASNGKPRLSAAGRARVAAAVKARWEKFRANKAKGLARVS